MAAFASITTGTQYLSRDIVNEVVLAYSERRQCVGDSAVDPVAVGFNLQTLSFWRGMQDWVETNCVKWVDDDEPIAGETAITMYTLATFRTEAGFDTDGFRRATEWPGSFTYGKMQAGDIIGPWVIEDLQKAFDAMRWTLRVWSGLTDSSANVETKSANSDEKTTSTDAVSDAVYKWGSASWTSTALVAYYDAYFRIFVSSGIYMCNLRRYRADYIFNNIPTHIYTDCAIYMQPDSLFADYYNDTDEYTEFEYVNTQNIEDSNADTITATKLSLDAAPVPSSFVDASTTTYEAVSNSVIAVLKWDFTNTL